MTMSLILAVPRRLVEGEKLVRSGKWEGWGDGDARPPNSWQRLGIIGMGRISGAVRSRRGFGLVHYHNRRRLHPETERELEAMTGQSGPDAVRMDIILSTARGRLPPTICLMRDGCRYCNLMLYGQYIRSGGRTADSGAV